MIRSKGEAGTGNIVEAVRHLRSILGHHPRPDPGRPRRALRLGQGARARRSRWSRRSPSTGKLPVPLFCAGGIATPSDAALVMQLGRRGRLRRIGHLQVVGPGPHGLGHRRGHGPLRPTPSTWPRCRAASARRCGVSRRRSTASISPTGGGSGLLRARGRAPRRSGSSTCRGMCASTWPRWPRWGARPGWSSGPAISTAWRAWCCPAASRRRCPCCSSPPACSRPSPRGSATPSGRCPLLGTCAGLVLVAREVLDGRAGPAHLRRARRRRAPQRLRAPGAVLRGRRRVRAPARARRCPPSSSGPRWWSRSATTVDVLATLDGVPVLVRQGTGAGLVVPPRAHGGPAGPPPVRRDVRPGPTGQGLFRLLIGSHRPRWATSAAIRLLTTASTPASSTRVISSGVSTVQRRHPQARIVHRGHPLGRDQRRTIGFQYSAPSSRRSASGGSGPSSQVSPMRASADWARNCCKRRHVARDEEATGERPCRPHRLQRTRHDLAPGEVDHQRQRDRRRARRRAWGCGRRPGRAPPPRPGPRRPPTSSRPHRRSSVWSCRTTMAPSRVRRRSISTMSAPRAAAAAKAGSVFSRWPTGSPRWAMATVRPGGGCLCVAGVDGARHVGDDLVERGLNEGVHRRLGDVHPVRARATMPSTTVE